MKFISYSNWHQLPDSVHALFEQGEKDSLFYSRQWFTCLSRTSRDDDLKLLLACVVDRDSVRAMLPLVKGTTNSAYAFTHRYTPVYRPLLCAGDQQSVLHCLAHGLSQLPLDGLVLEPVSEQDQNVIELYSAMEAAGYHCESNFRHYNWIYRLQGQSFAEYMASRPAKLRNTIVRKQRKLKREHDYEIRLFKGNEVPQAMADYYAVYLASWKAHEQYTGLVNDMVAGFSSEGWTRLGILYVHGQPVAAQLWLVHHAKANIFRLAYAEAWKRYSPGTILTHFMLQQAIDIDRVEEVDFLVGNEGYKQDWMSERRERVALSCVRNKTTTCWYRRIMRKR